MQQFNFFCFLFSGSKYWLVRFLLPEIVDCTAKLPNFWRLFAYKLFAFFFLFFF